MSNGKQVVGLMVWLALTFAAAAIGSVASVNAGDFYANLNRPTWAPPSWVFGPVWSVLYFMQALAAWLVWRERDKRATTLPLALYVAQLAVNAVWSWLFFAWRMGGLAFVDILVLWVLLLATIVTFWRVRPIAGALLVPYLLWVTFAGALNYTVWQGNPGSLG